MSPWLGRSISLPWPPADAICCSLKPPDTPVKVSQFAEAGSIEPADPRMLIGTQFAITVVGMFAVRTQIGLPLASRMLGPSDWASRLLIRLPVLRLSAPVWP